MRQRGEPQGTPRLLTFDDSLDLGCRDIKVPVTSDTDNEMGTMLFPGWGGSQEGQDEADRPGAPFG